ncbi:MAG: DNA polymerase ligase N-terminal domain-containing protein [Candidatus Dependentiae bacterium]
MPKKKNVLKTYKAKRDFTSSPEPIGDALAKKLKKSKKPIFVIQKHDASHLHYDFRLEIEGVLVSWAIPKGPSPDPRVKRLAIQTEDHPLDYAYFEGIIPEGYGAGEVMVWDLGTYENIKDISMAKSLKEGRIEVFLEGQKLQGGYALIRTKYGKDDSKKNWLFIKMKDDYADARKNPVSTKDYSVLTGRTLKQIKNDKDSEVYE